MPASLHNEKRYIWQENRNKAVSWSYLSKMIPWELGIINLRGEGRLWPPGSLLFIMESCARIAKPSCWSSGCARGRSPWWSTRIWIGFLRTPFCAAGPGVVLNTRSFSSGLIPRKLCRNCFSMASTWWRTWGTIFLNGSGKGSELRSAAGRY